MPDGRGRDNSRLAGGAIGAGGGEAEQRGQPVKRLEPAAAAALARQLPWQREWRRRRKILRRIFK